jgi:hypothetical protein
MTADFTASLLLQRAMAGLFGAAALAGCSSDSTDEPAAETCVEPTTDSGMNTADHHADFTGGQSDMDTGAPADTGSTPSTEPTVTSSTTDEELTFEAFVQRCDTLGGYVQVHAACAGVNSCAGLSFNKYSYELTEHTCQGLNSCGGFSCVVLPADGGLTGEEIATGDCSGCHGAGTFTVFVEPSLTEEEGLARFQARSAEQHERMVAFGIRGVYDGGMAFSNMPAYHRRYSRAEIERVVEYVRAMPANPSVFEIPE